MTIHQASAHLKARAEPAMAVLLNLLPLGLAAAALMAARAAGRYGLQ